MQTDLRKRFLGVVLSAVMAVSVLPQMQIIDVRAADSKTTTSAKSVTVDLPKTNTVNVSYSVTRIHDDIQAVAEAIKSESDKAKYDRSLQSFADERAAELPLYYSENTRPMSSLANSSEYSLKATGDDQTKIVSALKGGIDTYPYFAIGHARCNGTDYWIKVSRKSLGTEGYLDSINTTFTNTEVVDTSNIKNITVSYDPDSYDMESGTKSSLPNVSVSLTSNQMADSNPLKLNYSSVSWSTAYSKIATTTSSQIEAKNVGKTTLMGEVSISYDLSASLDIPVIVTPMTISDENVNIELQSNACPLSGGVATPDFTVELADRYRTQLKKDQDYTVTYGKNDKVGKGDFTITGIGNYTGTVKKEFIITEEVGGSLSTYGKAELAKTDGVVYDGTEKTPDVKVTFKGSVIDKSNYDVTYSDNIKAGTANIVVTGKGNLYTGTCKGTFKIEQASLSTATIEFKEKTIPYTGDYVKPEMTVKLGNIEVEASDYDATYENNIKMTTSSSKASVTIKGKTNGNFKDSKKQEFEISKGSLTGATVTAQDQGNTLFEPVYNGTPQKPFKVKVVCKGATKEIPESAYTVAYSEDLTNAGTVTMTVTGKGDFEGSTATGIYTIAPKDINVLTISQPSSKKFSSKEITQKITVRDGNTLLTEDKDYSLNFVDNLYPGTAKCTVVMSGNYTGSKEQSFSITLPKPSISSLTSTSGRFTVKWKKASGTFSGYQIKYSSKKVKVKKSKTGLTVTGLKSKRKYTVKVRTYYKDDSGTYYSSYSSGKSITIK